MDEKIDEAISDLKKFGRHWLPDPGSNEIHEAVEARLPNRVILHLEPPPWDEHVLVDASDSLPTSEELSEIAERRMKLREQKFKGRFPV